MAAKKAATKSRSSKSNKNKNNLKWWYVLPVIAIVAVAGYAIVRFSEAGTSSGQLRGGVRTVDKGNGNTAREVGNKPVTGTWSPVARGKATTFCARMFMSNGDGAGAATLSLYQGTSKLQASQRFSFRGTGERCITATTLDNFRIGGRNATLRVSTANGYVSVYSMQVK